MNKVNVLNYLNNFYSEIKVLMKSDTPNIYRALKFNLRKKLSDSEMQINSKNFLKNMSSRHTIRDFSKKKVPYSIIKNCIKVACLAPSGANHQPWHFCAISDQNVKREIRLAAEKEENKFYKNMKNDEWLRALEPLGTNANKPHLEDAPWLIIVFAERYGTKKNGSTFKNYYVHESVGIATGFLISAIHYSGLYCLTHTPNPMSFLRKICKRPLSNKASLILAVGHASQNATIPAAAKEKKTLKEVLTSFD